MSFSFYKHCFCLWIILHLNVTKTCSNKTIWESKNHSVVELSTAQWHLQSVIRAGKKTIASFLVARSQKGLDYWFNKHYYPQTQETFKCYMSPDWQTEAKKGERTLFFIREITAILENPNYFLSTVFIITFIYLFLVKSSSSENIHSKVCGLSRVAGTLFLGRDVAVEFF